jgi:hypothetical protein
MRIVREVLDAEVVDGQHNPLGKVDGVTLELRPRGRPRVAAIQIGAPVLARRLRRPLRTVIEWFARRWHADTMTIPWSKVRDVGLNIEVRLEGQHAASRDWERWLAEHVVTRIPGG